MKVVESTNGAVSQRSSIRHKLIAANDAARVGHRAMRRLDGWQGKQRLTHSRCLLAQLERVPPAVEPLEAL